MRRVAFYGGAFDPPHAAHLFTITWLLGLADVDEVWVAPTADHVFGKSMAPFAARVEMLRAALAPFDPARVRICEIEVERQGPSRSYDTLAALEQRHPDARFTLVVGADNLTESHRWYRFDDLVVRWPVIALGRPGHEAALAAAAEERWCRAGPTLPDVSSTAVRAALAGRGEASVLRWVPDAVLALARPLYASVPGEVCDSVWIFGAGRAGRALLAALRGGGVPVAGVWNRTPNEDATAEGQLPEALGGAAVWLLCVRDEALPELAARLAAHPAAGPGRVALHCAGRFGAEVLAPLAARGVATGSLHPLQSLRGPESADGLRGAFCAVEGGPEARAAARRLVAAVGARPVELPSGEKAAYHAAAVFSANFVTTLGAGGVALLGALGVDEATARGMLAPLLRGTVTHFERTPGVAALTGPFARGDVDAVAAHVEALRRHAPDLIEPYAALARVTARWAGWSEPQRARLDALLSGS